MNDLKEHKERAHSDNKRFFIHTFGLNGPINMGIHDCMSTLQLESNAPTRFLNACRATRPTGTNQIRISPRAANDNDVDDDPSGRSTKIIACTSEKLVKLKFNTSSFR